LFFYQDQIILVLIDEATRFTMAEVIPNKEAETILSAVTNTWCRVFGPPAVLMSDHEGGLVGEAAAQWADKWGIQLRPGPKGSHAYIIERHHQILRATLHKIQSQTELEELGISFPMLLAEAVYVKNALTAIAGHSPFEAVFGRVPRLLFDVEEGAISADAQGTHAAVNRHVARLREIAFASMVSATAQQRIQRTAYSNSRHPAEALGLQVEDVVDNFRKATTKDQTGWRGPAVVIGVETAKGYFDIKWQGRAMSVTSAEIRRHIFFGSTSIMFSGFASGDQLHTILDFLQAQSSGVFTMAVIQTAGQWTLSKSAQEHPLVLRALLHIAHTTFGLQRALGARIGRGGSYLSGLSGVEMGLLIWWPFRHPELYRPIQHDGA
jgi:hypothetical protein